MNIYVGNLSYQATEDDLQKLFEAYGQVKSVAVIKDKFTGRSRGFAFVEMANKSEAVAAIQALNEKEFMGRNLRINEAQPRENRGGGGYGNRDRGGGGGGGYGGRDRDRGGYGSRDRGYNDRDRY
ncbi:MAG: RNA-binding protein [Anaerolineae bacterium]|nr:RNA-binding protein [Anaerolineae bacterium]